MATIQDIVRRLKEASHAYYNTGVMIMTDNEYDSLRDQLEGAEPDHPFLHDVGAVPDGKACKLPYIMASLNKIKPATGSVAAFVQKATVKAWFVSEKLDGISALWFKGRLYLRGDGETGVDITQMAMYLKGLAATKYAVRGELIVPRKVLPSGTLARSWVNGQLHQKTPIPQELSLIHFVAYEIVAPVTLTSQEQFSELRKAGFEVPWSQLIHQEFVNDESLCKMLQSRREISTYDTDGIVIAENRAEPPTTVVKNPTHKVAFKMLLDDQCAKTMVVDVEWNASAHGFLIPRLKITPVVVGTARIEYVTAHNAKFVVDNKIAPGTVIIVKRSGDVIPAVERIVTASVEPKMPEGSWKWNGVHLELSGDTVSKEVLVAQFVRFSGKFELVGLGPGVAQKLVNAGLDTPGKICRASTATLVAAVGKALGPKLATQFADLATGTTELQWMVASNCMPRGIGETRLAALFAVEVDPRKWSELPAVPAGLSADTVQEILGAIPAYLKWRETQTPAGLPPFPIMVTASVTAVPVTAVPVQRGTVCFTGVRDKALEADLTAAGWKSVDTINKSLNLLIVPDGPLVATVKVKKAQDLGSVRILALSEVRNQILI